MENETTNTVIETRPKEYSGIIGAIIIIIILLAGGWYFIGKRVEKIEKIDEVSAIQISTGTSTEIEDIQKDLDNLNLDVLNQ